MTYAAAIDGMANIKPVDFADHREVSHGDEQPEVACERAGRSQRHVPTTRVRPGGCVNEVSENDAGVDSRQRVAVSRSRAEAWRALGESNPSCKIENLES